MSLSRPSPLAGAGVLSHSQTDLVADLDGGDGRDDGGGDDRDGCGGGDGRDGCGSGGDGAGGGGGGGGVEAGEEEAGMRVQCCRETGPECWIYRTW